MVWVGGRHALPPPVIPRSLQVPVGSGGPGNYTGPGQEAALPAAPSPPAPAPYSSETLLLMAIVLMLIPVIIILLYLPRHRARWLGSGLPSALGGVREWGRYHYEGFRLAIRRAYVELVERVRVSAADYRPGHTPSEVEEIAVRLNLALEGMARLYSEYIYSPRRPGPGDVERFRRYIRVG